jgi:hypothetical protein
MMSRNTSELARTVRETADLHRREGRSASRGMRCPHLPGSLAYEYWTEGQRQREAEIQAADSVSFSRVGGIDSA